MAPWKTVFLYEQAIFHFHDCFREGTFGGPTEDKFWSRKEPFKAAARSHEKPEVPPWPVRLSLCVCRCVSHCMRK